MGIELKAIGDLKDMKFFIPCYQRGYRWTERQVEDLLKDIQEFIESKADWYCLQPLVVKVKKCDSDCYEVIDGQQRLTTLYLIYKYLIAENHPLTEATELFHYEYERDNNNERKNFLRDIIEKNDKNIDFFFMSQAYHKIKDWFKGNEKLKNDFKKLCEAPKNEKSIQVIWYELQDKNSIKVFRRLNVGKIPLTNAELIKALFLNKSNFPEQSEQLRQRQMEIAMEWDQIEYTLQNDEFWSFIYRENWKISTRIDLLFNLIVEKNDFALSLEIDKTDDYHTFRYFYKYFKDKENKMDSAKKCWSKVKEYFQIFQEWFNDLRMYHYVGFLVNQGKKLTELVNWWEKNKTKQNFIKELMEEIAKTIKKCPSIDYQYKTDGSDKTKCKPILLLHNIQIIINQATVSQEQYGKAVFHRFPFHIFQEEKWDVEHINSAVTNDESDSTTQKEWLLNVFLVVSENLQDEIKNFLKDEKNRENDEYQKLKKKIEEEIKAENNEWTDEEKNKIENYTLLDSSTNRSYGNALFSAKRRVIIGKERSKRVEVKFEDGKIKVSETAVHSAFVPPCTRQVFLKYFSPIAGNMNYWTKEDAKNYLKEMKITLADFFSNDNQGGQ